MSLGIYRNLHPHLLNKFKQEYGKKLEKIFSKYDPVTKPIIIHILMQFKGKRRRDIDNHATVVLKTLQDALVNVGFIPDDDMKFIKQITLSGVTEQDETKIIVKIEETT